MNTRNSYACKNDASKSVTALSFLYLSLYKNVTRAILGQTNDAENFVNKVCLHLCPLECNQTLYKTSMSSEQLVGNRYVAKLRETSRF
jgi:hypothetical protein